MQEMDTVLDEALDELDDDFQGETSKSDGHRSDSKESENVSPSGVKIVLEDVSESTEKQQKEKKNEETEEHVSVEASEQYGPQTVEEALGSLFEEMNRTNIEDLGQEDDFLKEVLALADSGTETFDADAVIDGMMEQLLSKELMYEPMKEVLDKFPNYLDKNKAILSEEEYQR